MHNLLENFVNDLEALLKKTRSKLKKVQKKFDTRV
jgi:hypothetical protein